MARIRRKGSAFVETSQGILVVADKDKKFILPGDGAKKWESRKKAVRELKEETGLIAIKTKYLFSYRGREWIDNQGRPTINHAKVFLIAASGCARPRCEIKYLSYWKPGSRINISRRTKLIIEEYYKIKKKFFR